MGYFKRKIRSFMRWAMDDSVQIDSEANAKVRRNISTSPGSLGDDMGGMNFTVHNATGGKVIQFRTYNPRTDSGRTALYVITEKDDLGEELGMIITRETLSQ